MLGGDGSDRAHPEMRGAAPGMSEELTKTMPLRGPDLWELNQGFGERVNQGHWDGAALELDRSGVGAFLRVTGLSENATRR